MAAARRVALTLLAACCSVGLILGPATAVTDPSDRKRSVDKAIENLKEDLEDTSADLAAAYTKLKLTQAKVPAAQSALDRAVAAAADASAEHTLAVQRVQLAKASEAKAEQDLVATRKSIAASRDQVARFANRIYQDSGFGEMDMVLGSQTPQQFADRLVLGETVMDVQSATMERLANQKAMLVALEDRLAALRAEAVTAEAAAKAALDRANAARASAASAKSDLDALVADQASTAAAIKGQLGAEKKRLAALTAESNALKATLAEIARKRKLEEARRLAEWKKKHPNTPKPPPTATGTLFWPTAGGINSAFGMRYHPILHYWRLHAGVDIGGACGQPIYAAEAGVVVEARVTSGSGLRVVIDHGIMRGVSLATTYNHLSRFAVTGGSVRRGQLIGSVGDTGLSTACHLHFETYENGVPVNPTRWL